MTLNRLIRQQWVEKRNHIWHVIGSIEVTSSHFLDNTLQYTVIDQRLTHFQVLSAIEMRQSLVNHCL